MGLCVKGRALQDIVVLDYWFEVEVDEVGIAA